MNKHQRKNKRLRNHRANVTGIKAGMHEPKRPLHGFEAFYSITAGGQLWSNRLERYIKPTLGLDGYSLHLQFRINGQIHKMSIWQAVADSWLPDNIREQILEQIPDAAVSGDKILWALVDIPKIVSNFGIDHGLVRHLVSKEHNKRQTFVNIVGVERQ